MSHDNPAAEKAMPILQDAALSDTSEQSHHRKSPADPGPLGLSAFALTTFVMAMFNLSAGGSSVPNIIIGPALIYGGLGQILAGMWDMAVGNTVSATIAVSYGCFWMSFAVILIPAFGVEAAYSNPAEYNHGMGFFLLGFFIFSLAVTMVSTKGSLPFLVLTILVNCTWLFLTIAHFHTGELGQASVVFKKIAGVFGVLVALTAWYNMYEGLANKSNSYVLPPKLPLIRKQQ
jgi:succinate-acetate transporter protein